MPLHQRLTNATSLFIAVTILIFANSTVCRAQDNDAKIPPIFKTMLGDFDARGESAALDHAKRHGVRYFQKNGQEALFPFVLEMNDGITPKNFDRTWLNNRGIVVDAVSKSYIRVLAPMRLIRTLAQHPQIRALNTPLKPNAMSVGLGSTVTEAVRLTNADSLQAQGIKGSNVGVAVVDLGFIGLNAAKGSELPAGTVTINLPGSNDDNIETVTSHGVEVAEQLADMAPEIQLYCIMIGDIVDMDNAIDTIRARRIRIANHSVGWTNGSYYDDKGKVDSLVNFSHDNDGVFWAVSSGNEARRHWRGKWKDTDGDSLLEFLPGIEAMPISEIPYGNSMTVSCNWNQYKTRLTDLNLYVYDKNNHCVDSSVYSQPYYPPAENVTFPYSASLAPYSIKVKKRLGPISADTFDITLFSPDADLQYPVAGSSLQNPADAHGAFSVGAVSINNWPLSPPTIDSYSSQGPTNDGRMKPDLVGPDSTRVSLGTGMQGTSFSSPVVAGAAALFLQKYPALSVTALEDSLRAMAMDVGQAGTDSVYGAGLLYVYLPPPAPALPPNNSSGLSVSQTLTWSTVRNAVFYQLQVSTNPAFSSFIVQDSLLTTGSKSVTGLSNGTTYYWRVRSRNAHTAGPWSAYRAFSTIRQFSLAITAAHGTVAKSPDLVQYDSGTVVTLTASAGVGATFTGWSGDLSGSANPATVAMSGNKSIVANFPLKQYSLTTTATHGSVLRSPDQSAYDSGTVVTLTPIPLPGYHFTGWTGDQTDATNPLSTIMTGAKNIAAVFSINTYTVTVASGGNGLAKPSGTFTIIHGDTLKDTANPNSGFTFVNWTTAGNITAVATGVMGKFVVTGNGTIQANFAVTAFPLTVTAANGTVAKVPDQSVFDTGTTVTLTAAPRTGYHFTGWSGDLAGTSASATLGMTGPKNVTANFAINSYTVTVSCGNGQTKPSGALTFNHGDTLVDTAIPNPGYSFVNWSVPNGISAIESNTVGKFIITGPGSIAANFAIKQYTLTINAPNGTVSKSPDQNVYDSGTVITLTAIPPAGFSFTGWSQDASGTTNPLSISMSAPKTISVGFLIDKPPTPVLTFPANNNASVGLSPELSWNASARAVAYHLQLSTKAAFGDTIINDTAITALSKIVGPLTNNTTYYWRVDAGNAGGTSGWSAAWSFTTLPPLPSKVQLLFPKDTAIVTADSSGFSWTQSVPAADKFQLEIAKDSSMATIVFFDSTLTDTVKTISGLSNKSGSFWRVTAHDAAGWGTQSAVYKFMVRLPVSTVLPKTFSCKLTGLQNSSSSVRYAIPIASKVRIRIFSMQGKLAATLCDAFQSPGYYRIPLAPFTASDNYYILDFRAGDFAVKKKLCLFR